MVTTVTAMPTPAPNRTMAQLEFDQAYAARIAAEPLYTAQFNAAVAETNENTIAAAASQLAAAASQLAAANSQAIASAAATTATSAPGTNATSTTSLTVGVGNKSLTLAQTGKLYVPGQYVSIASTASPDNLMSGNITAHNPATGAMTVNVSNFKGSGTFAAWTVALVGAPALSGIVNEQRGSDIASASTVNLDAANGNYVHITGAATVNALTLSAGASRQCTADGAFTLVNSASLILPGLIDIKAGAGDTFVARGEGGGVTRVTSYTRAKGEPVTIIPPFNRVEFFSSSGSFTAKVTGWHRFSLQGANGSGAVAVLNGDVASAAAASGGATGGNAVLTAYCIAGSSYTITLGAGGAAATIAAGTARSAVNGNAGGTSTITGPAVAMTCTSGNGGNAVTTITPGATATAAGATGGTATGGDVNIQGAPSGVASAKCGVGTSAGNLAATGGAAIPWRGMAYASGSASVTAATSNGVAASGGAGVGGKSGDATANGAGPVTASTSGGGSRGPSASATTTTSANDTNFGIGLAAPATEVAPLALTGVGGSAVGAAAAGPGGGSGANVTQAGLSSGSAGFGGGSGPYCGGSGPMTSSGSATGGASGAVASTGSPGASSGVGGNAFALVEYYV